MELPEMLDALDPRSSKGTASALPSALLAELEEIQSIGGPTHIQGVGRRSVSFTGGPHSTRMQGANMHAC